MDMNQETKVTVIDDRLRQEEAETLCRWAAARAASSLIISSRCCSVAWNNGADC